MIPVRMVTDVHGRGGIDLRTAGAALGRLRRPRLAARPPLARQVRTPHRQFTDVHGRGGIRTHAGRCPHDFQSCALSHSATRPAFRLNRGARIRTGDLCDPNAALYRTEPRPVKMGFPACRRGERRGGLERRRRDSNPQVLDARRISSAVPYQLGLRLLGSAEGVCDRLGLGRWMGRRRRWCWSALASIAFGSDEPRSTWSTRHPGSGIGLRAASPSSAVSSVRAGRRERWRRPRTAKPPAGQSHSLGAESTMWNAVRPSQRRWTPMPTSTNAAAGPSTSPVPACHTLPPPTRGGVVLIGKAPHSKCGVRQALGGSSPSASAPDPPAAHPGGRRENPSSRGVAQSGRALRSGRRGPRFESGRPDLAGKQDGWPSGLRRTTGNRVGICPRGFESHPVRERQ